MTKIVSNIWVATALAAAVLAAAATFPAAPVQAADTEVKIHNFAFAPQRTTVKAGTTVTWINEDDIPHTVTSTTLAFKSKPLDSDDKYAFTFTSPGTYTYFCSLHPHMTGSIVVEAATGSASPP